MRFKLLLPTTLLLWISLTSPTQSSTLCSKGCLNCSEDGTCNLCNFYSNMFLKEDVAFNRYDNPNSFRGSEEPEQCQFNFIDNCLRTFPQGKCKECRKGFSLDKFTGNCVIEAIENKVEHCIDYLDDLCVRCGNAYILRENECVKSFIYRQETITSTDEAGVETTQISNISFDLDLNATPEKIFECEIYETNTGKRCRKCSKGHYVTEDFKCRKYLSSSTFDPNCASVATFKCFACDDGYALLNNSFLDRTFSDGVDHFNEIYRFLKNNIEGYFESLSNNTCIPRTIDGCIEYSGITTCIKCNESQGYYLTEEKKCLLITTEYIIPHCEEYLNKTKCVKCNKYFKLNATNTACEVVKYISHCKTHLGSSTLNLCQTCEEDFYLATPDNCLPRSTDPLRYDNCKTKDPSADYCGQCMDGFIFSASTFECIAVPEGCAVYAPNNDPAAETPFHICTLCQPLFYLDPENKTCVAVSNANCRVYDPVAGACSECLPTFYLKTLDGGDKECSAHDTELFPNCKIFSPDTKNKCLYCGEGCNILENKSQCVRRDYSDMCEWYDEKGEQCVGCFDGWELSNNGDCRMIDSKNHCLAGTSEFCWICKEGYQRVFSGTNLDKSKCVKNEEHLSKNCENGIGKNCVQCSLGSIMFNFEDKFQCVSKHWFDDSAAINHCQRYSRFTDDTLMCIQCKEGFALIESSNTCVSFEDCSGTVVIGRQDENYEFSIFDEKYVICDTAQDKNVCAIKAVGNNKTGDFVCIGCSTTHSPIVDAFSNSEANHSFTKLSGDSFQPLSPISTYSEVKECISNLDATFATYKVSGCSQYYKAGTGPGVYYGCLSCEWGKTGNGQVIDTTKTSIKNCFNYLNECDTSVRYHGLSHDYYHVTGTGPDVNWDSLLSCHKCADSNKIPFLFLDDNNLPTQYSFYIEEEKAFDFGTDGVIMRCIEPHKLAIELFLNYLVEDDFISQCGVGRIDTTSEKWNHQKLDNTQVTCIACLPGYVPTYASNGVTSCSVIAHCDYEEEQIWFNKCSRCKKGYAYEFNDTDMVADYTACVSFSDTKCRVFKGAHCMFCEDGYLVSPDGTCQKFEIPGCAMNYDNKGTLFSDSMRMFTKFELAFSMYNDILFWQNPGSGCDSCLPQYLNIKENISLSPSVRQLSNFPSDISQISRNFSKSDMPTDPVHLLPSYRNSICVRAIDTFDFFVTEDFYTLDNIPIQFENMISQVIISNCELYSLHTRSFSPICSRCKAGYLPSFDYSECHAASSNLANCVLASSSSKCARCELGFVLNTNRSCESLGIDHCVEFAYLNTTYASNATSLRCIRCENGFFTEDGVSCSKIMIEGCVAAFNADTCVKCEDGKFLFENGFVSECRDVGERIDCAQPYLDIQNDSVYCLGCGSGDYVIKKLDFSETSDFSYTEWDKQSQFSISKTKSSTPNCQKYSDIISTETSSLFWLHLDRPSQSPLISFIHSTQFACIECLPGYFLNLETQQCDLRVSNDPLCHEQEENSNRCKECVSTAFLDRVSGVCELSPNRETNCAVFTEMGLCLACANNTYPVTVILDEHEDRLKGQDRYVPDIIKLTEANSSTETTSDSTESDSPTHTNITTTFKYECQPLPAENDVLNCVSYDKYKRCHQCAPTHSLFDSKCITIQAENCEVLHDPYTCRTCPKGFKMDAPTTVGPDVVTSCSEIDLIRCEDKSLEEVTGDSGTTFVKICNRCEKGYFFNTETRTCDSVTSPIENCDYYETNTTCMFCKEKYLLSNDNTTCQIKLQNYYHGDQNCSLGVIQNKPICDACKQGFYLDLDNNCRPCASQGINSVPNYCAICSPRSPNKCLMCAEGYDMNKEGFCQLTSE